MDLPVPESPRPKSKHYGRRGKLTPEQRQEVIRRVEAGERGAIIARDYDITRQAVHIIHERHTNPEKAHRQGLLRSRLLPEERKKLIELMRTSTPEDHGVENEGYGHPHRWTSDRAIALGMRLFQKRMFIYAVREYIQEAHPDRRWDPDAKPDPPGPPDIRDLSPELAADPEFVEYYFSPLAQQIRQKEYEWALREYEKRQAHGGPPKKRRGRPPKIKPEQEAAAALDDEEEPYDGTKPLPGDMNPGALGGKPAPGRRVGKHGSGKGAPFTKPKRKKKKS